MTIIIDTPQNIIFNLSISVFLVYCQCYLVSGNVEKIVFSQFSSSFPIVTIDGFKSYVRVEWARVSLRIKTSIVTIGSMKTVKTFFLAFPALNSTAMIKKLKYSNSYLIVAQIHRSKMICMLTTRWQDSTRIWGNSCRTNPYNSSSIQMNRKRAEIDLWSAF